MFTTSHQLAEHCSFAHLVSSDVERIIYNSGFQSVSQGNRGYMSVMAALKFNVLLKIIAKLMYLAMCFFMTIRISN